MLPVIENTLESAKILADVLMASDVTPVFDMDGVFIDATHRQICNPDGSLNLDKYREMSTAEHIAKDAELPLIHAIQILQKNKIAFHICTARVFCENTTNWLEARNIKPVSIMSRDGLNDTRRDFELKTAKLLAAGIPNAVLIDDNLNNCKAAMSIGLLAVHVPFEGH